MAIGQAGSLAITIAAPYIYNTGAIGQALSSPADMRINIELGSASTQ